MSLLRQGIEIYLARPFPALEQAYQQLQANAALATPMNSPESLPTTRSINTGHSPIMPEVLTSHSPFRKRRHSEAIDAAESQRNHPAAPGDVANGAVLDNTQEQDQDKESESDESFVASLYEDELDNAELDPYVRHEDEEGFPPEEAKRLRDRLRSVGANRFIEENLSSGSCSVRTLVTAFGVRPDLPYGESWYLRMLGLLIQRELQRRQKLEEYNTIDDAVSLLQKSKKIIVITGAGISTSLGIPDFRSKNTGFYSQLKELGYNEPEEVFDIENFDDNPSVFYSLAKEILPVVDRCSPTHEFIKLLQDKGKLLTNYTQNIDNIEAYAGISPDRLIQCHGSWAMATCRKCQAMVPGEAIFEDVRAGRVAKCKRCPQLLREQPPRKKIRGSASSNRSRSRSDISDDEDDGQYDIPEPGVMKPNITFFGEKLPNTFFDRLTEQDKDVVDLVVVIGTSMKVAPVSDIPDFIPSSIPQIYISREPANHINFDMTLLGYCDDVVAELCRRAGWILDHEKVRSGVAAEVEACEGSAAHWRIKTEGITSHSKLEADEHTKAD